MVFTLVALLGAGVGGAILGAGGVAAFKSKLSAEVTVLKADVEAEVAKVSPDLTALITKAKALLAKL